MAAQDVEVVAVVENVRLHRERVAGAAAPASPRSPGARSESSPTRFLRCQSSPRRKDLVLGRSRGRPAEHRLDRLRDSCWDESTLGGAASGEAWISGQSGWSPESGGLRRTPQTGGPLFRPARAPVVAAIGGVEAIPASGCYPSVTRMLTVPVANLMHSWVLPAPLSFRKEPRVVGQRGRPMLRRSPIACRVLQPLERDQPLRGCRAFRWEATPRKAHDLRHSGRRNRCIDPRSLLSPG